MTIDEAGVETVSDPMAAARAVADAVLYEGYLLYPYRASAAKNQLRWQFGVLVPPGYAAADTGEQASLATECLFDLAEGALLHVRLRFLQLVTQPLGRWDEAVPREVDVVVPVTRLSGDGWLTPFTVPGGAGEEPTSGVVGDRAELRGELLLRAEPVPGPHGLLRLAAEVSNTSDWDGGGGGELAPRSEALRHSLVATHLLFVVTSGQFHSLLDPPQWARAGVEACQQRGAWPVLVGDPAEGNAVLASPIILYDYPAVAPESPGDFFDSTEIDELLSLRTLTLTEAEKQEARRTDPRAAQLIDRVEAMPPEVLARLHGTIRGLTPVPGPGAGTDGASAAPVPAPGPTVEVAGQPVGRGSRVRLAPGSRRTDAQDMFLVGRLATVREVLRDVDGGCYLAVTLDDDPGADLHLAHGRFRYFAPDEVAPLTDDEPVGEAEPATPPEPARPVETHRVLVAGVGNIFLGDDGFGVELARRLAAEELPAGVQVADYGISGVHLAYDLLRGYAATILLDAAARGEAPGTVSVLEVGQYQAIDPGEAVSALDGHGMQPDRVLGLLRTLGGDPGRVLVVACEPAQSGYGIGLSEPVADAVGRAIPVVRELVAEQLARSPLSRGEEES